MILSIQNLQFNVEDKGEGDVILFLHGFTGSASNWQPFIDAWSHRYRCIAVDLIGHGKSSKPQNVEHYTMDAMADYLKAILDHLHVTRANILGYSMGGRLALSFATKYPSYVKSLILESSSPGLQTPEEREERIKKDHVLATRISEQGIAEFVSFWESLPLFAGQKKLPDSVQNKIRKQRLSNSSIGLINSLKGMGTGAQDSNWENLQHVNVPTLLLVGEHDKKFITIAKSMAQRLSDGVIKKVNDAGHTIHVEQPRIFDKMVVGFLEKLFETQN